MKKTDYEDIIMKRAMDIFAEAGLKFFGIDKKVKEMAPTELVVLETKKMYMDYTFLMEDNTYIHFEFQTTDKGIKDLMRFRAYEALLNYQTEKNVTTYVIYTGDIINPISQYQSGINTYKVNAISMLEKDGDKIIELVQKKISSGEELTKQDIISLTFTPIMGGKMTKAEKIISSIRITKKISSEYSNDIQSILYAFASKFLSGKDLEKVKEELKMTELGRSLIQEGKDEGIKEGIEIGKAELIIKQIMKKFKKLPTEYKEKIKKLPDESLDLIGMDIFDMGSVEELTKYFD